MATRGQQQETIEVVEQTGMNPAVMASAASVLLSWYYFFARGEPQKGIFVGLWPPTILAFASYFRQTRMSDLLNRTMGSSGIMGRVERMMQGK